MTTKHRGARVEANVSASRRAFVLMGGATLAACAAAPQARQAGRAIVETASGRIEGYLDKGVLTFKGVPYGASTAGQGRFRPPQPPAPWGGIRSTVAFGPPSPQGRPASMPAPAPVAGATPSLINNSPTQDQSEDCLVLNVWTKSTDGRKPVMVWLHGGGFSTGSGSSDWYDGVNLATRQDVVVVTINHRLNVFGYLFLDEISNGAYLDSATVGLLDCCLALEWVKQNIAAFGGDPSRVMIFGESGGGRKVSSLMALTPATGLFHTAAIQSGSQLRLETPAVANERTHKLLKALDIPANQLARLHDVPVDAMLGAALKAQAGTGQFRPVAGTAAMPSHPFDPAAPKMSADIPVIAGSNRTEASLFLGGDPRVIALDDAGLLERVKGLVPAGRAQDVIAMYRRLYPSAQPPEILYMASTDRGYFLDTTILAERKATLSRAPAYVYQFYRETPVEGGRYFCPHASEIPFVFDNLELATRMGGPVTPSAQALADRMSAAWAAFARTGSPDTPDMSWATYDAFRPTLIWDEPSRGGVRVENDPRSEQRKLMLSFGSQQYADREGAPA